MQFDYDTCDRLITLQRRYGAKLFGKIAQCLMAITLHELGWKNIRNHISEDADLDAVSDVGDRYTFEVKTSESHCVHVDEKDIRCIKQRGVDGYRGFFLVLRVGRQAEWFAVPYKENGVQVGNIDFVHFRNARDPSLSDAFNSQFGRVLDTHYEYVDTKGLSGLMAKMDKMGIESIE